MDCCVIDNDILYNKILNVCTLTSYNSKWMSENMRENMWKIRYKFVEYRNVYFVRIKMSTIRLIKLITIIEQIK